MIDDTAAVMAANLAQVAERGERLDSLVDKTDSLGTSSRMFYKSAKKTSVLGMPSLPSLPSMPSLPPMPALPLGWFGATTSQSTANAPQLAPAPQYAQAVLSQAPPPPTLSYDAIPPSLPSAPTVAPDDALLQQLAATQFQQQYSQPLSHPSVPFTPQYTEYGDVQLAAMEQQPYHDSTSSTATDTSSVLQIQSGLPDLELTSHSIQYWPSQEPSQSQSTSNEWENQEAIEWASEWQRPYTTLDESVQNPPTTSRDTNAGVLPESMLLDDSAYPSYREFGQPDQSLLPAQQPNFHSSNQQEPIIGTVDPAFLFHNLHVVGGTLSQLTPTNVEQNLHPPFPDFLIPQPNLPAPPPDHLHIPALDPLSNSAITASTGKVKKPRAPRPTPTQSSANGSASSKNKAVPTAEFKRSFKLENYYTKELDGSWQCKEDECIRHNAPGSGALRPWGRYKEGAVATFKAAAMKHAFKHVQDQAGDDSNDLAELRRLTSGFATDPVADIFAQFPAERFPSQSSSIEKSPTSGISSATDSPQDTASEDARRSLSHSSTQSRDSAGPPSPPDLSKIPWKITEDYVWVPLESAYHCRHCPDRQGQGGKREGVYRAKGEWNYSMIATRAKQHAFRIHRQAELLSISPGAIVSTPSSLFSLPPMAEAGFEHDGALEDDTWNPEEEPPVDWYNDYPKSDIKI
ncbi:hypothetical protein T439DRAFT_128614 [Meredithblackwellia eburnea MCA 4105]